MGAPAGAAAEQCWPTPTAETDVDQTRVPSADLIFDLCGDASLAAEADLVRPGENKLG